MDDIPQATQRMASWLQAVANFTPNEESLVRLLEWAKDEFEKEDFLPAAISQRYSFRDKPPRHVAADLGDEITFIPGQDWAPTPILLVFTSTPDQFSARLALAHDYFIRHSAHALVLVTDYFDNQAFSRPAATLEALRDSNGIKASVLLHTALGFHFFPILD